MRALDGATFTLMLLAAICAENIPFMLALTIGAGVCILVKGVYAMNYKVCPECGAHLDPGEVCDCTKKTAADAANIDDGKTDKTVTKTI